jgi:hypothetical protein
VKEYLAALEAEVEPNPDRKPLKVISPSDPQSAWTTKANKRVQYGYRLNHLINIENAVIVDVEPRPARTHHEVEATKTMLDRTERRFELKPKHLAAERPMGLAVSWAGSSATESRRTFPFAMPASAMMAFSRSDFRWDRWRGVYICPNDKVLHTTGTVHAGQMLRYRASSLTATPVR